MKGKPATKSRTIVGNSIVAVLAVGVAAAAAALPALAPILDPKWMAIATAIVAAANVALRFDTDQPIRKSDD